MAVKNANTLQKQFTLKKVIPLILIQMIFFSQMSTFAQTSKRDSLEHALHKYKRQNSSFAKDSTYISLLNDLGDEMRYYKADSLLIHSKNALKLSEQINFHEGQSRAYIGIGNFHSDKGEYEEAIVNYQKAKKAADIVNNKQLNLTVQNVMAGLYDYKGDYAEALSRYLKCIELAKEIKNNDMLSIINENIANLYANQEDYEQAILFYKAVKRINKEIGNEVYSAETMSNIASVYADMGELDYAMFNVNSSIATFEKHQIMDWLAYAYEVKGKTYLKDNDYKWALYWYKQSELLHDKLEDDRGKSTLLNGMAEAYLGQRKDSISEQYALEAYTISKQINMYEDLQRSAKTLYRINKNKGDFDTALEYHEIYQTIHDTTVTNKSAKSLTMLMTKMGFERQKEDLIDENTKALASQKRYIYAAFFILMIFLAVTLIVRRNEKIQKKLNVELYEKTAKLVENEKKLRDINETKDKLFSIIGHDLRGPIGAFQGLLTLYREGEIDGDDFLQFIPKLGADIDNISFTLNNLLSWGQTQMNGSVTKPSIVPLANLINDNINLLTETAETKSISVTNKVDQSVMSWSDSNQVDIIIRNLISNSLKFTPNDGLITISASERSTTWEVCVRDNGVGMDQETQKKIFQKNSNVTTYGTNDEKGTGLGLSLCKEMVEKNNGKIWVESALSEGTSFYFTLPKVRDKSTHKAAS